MVTENEFGAKLPADLLDTGHFTDVAFIFKQENDDNSDSETRIPAHKMILAFISPVFNSMFYGDLKETGDVIITDATAEGFTEFLQLFYKPEVKFTIDNIAEVMKLIDKYDVAGGLKTIEKFLLNSVTVENVCSFYELAAPYKLSDDVINEFKNMIGEHFEKILKSSTFAELNPETVTDILQWDEMNCAETDLFNAVVARATQSLQQRQLTIDVDNIKEELKDVIKYIRFPTMSTTEFVEILEEYPGLLEPRVFCDILCYIGSQRTMTVAKEFNTKKRYYWYWYGVDEENKCRCGFDFDSGLLI